MKKPLNFPWHFFRLLSSKRCSSSSYVQGQSPEPKIREYFYYIDHNGQLFLDDSKMKNFTSCFKDKEFLVFFFTRIRRNETRRYLDDFPYVSLCGRERNFIRCDDTPVVFTGLAKIDDDVEEDRFFFANAADIRLSVPFDPSLICMNPTNGRVYYPLVDIAEKYGGDGYGLVKSSIVDDRLSPLFRFDMGVAGPPTRLFWNNVDVKLTNELLPLLKSKPKKSPL